MFTPHVSCSALKMRRGLDEEDFELSSDKGELGLYEATIESENVHHGGHRGRTYIMYHGTTRQNARSIQATGFARLQTGCSAVVCT